MRRGGLAVCLAPGLGMSGGLGRGFYWSPGGMFGSELLLISYMMVLGGGGFVIGEIDYLVMA